MPAKRSRKTGLSGGTYAEAPPSATKSGKPTTQPGGAAEIADVNLQAAGLLYDMAALQPTERSRFGYKRAAKAILYLPVPVGDLVEAGTLRDVSYVGPASTRIVTELVRQGSSPTVEAALDQSSKGAAIRAQRPLRAGFLSHLQLAQALAADSGDGIVSKGDYRGDFQMHSTWSDGGETIGAMADAAMALGHTCLGITDHSYGLPVARGISMEQASRQWTEIDRLNTDYEGRFRVYKGIEANILVDGALDLQPNECAL